MKVTRRFSFAIVVLALTGAACSGTSADKPAQPAPQAAEIRRGGTLTTASSQKITGFNQFSPTSANLLLYNVMAQVWPSAFRLTPDGQYALNEDLIESAQQTSASPQTIVYRINPRAVWSDGDPIDGRDFVYLWRTAYTRGAKDVDGSDIATTTTNLYGVIDNVTVSEDGRTVTVVLARPYPDWKTLFTLLVPSHIAERVGFNKGFRNFDPAVMVSGGPFRMGGYRPDQDVTLVRNERYWATPANLDSIVVRLLPDSGQLLAAIKNREVDFADLVSPTQDEVVQARAVPGLVTVSYEQARYERLFFNFANEHLAVPEVRRAIALALDRPGIVARLGGQIDPAKAKFTNNRLYTPTEPEYRDTSGGRYDRGNAPAARQLLESAGFQRGPDGVFGRAGKRLSLRLPVRPAIDELIQSQLREAGIEVRIEPSPNLLETMRRGEFDVGLLSRPTSPGAKAAETTQFATGGGWNLGKYSNPEVDRLINQANAELDEARRVSLYHRIDEILWDDMVTVPLQQALSALVHRDSVVNMVPSSDGGIFVSAHKWGLKSSR